MINTQLHLEISSKCLLRCHACPRTEYFGEYTVQDLPLAHIEKISKVSWPLKEVLLCGDHGDPIYHSKFHEVIEVLKKIPCQPRIKITTNGSHRDIDWWKTTAKILRPQDILVFSIDGLEDTNHIYRQGAKWNSIDGAIRTMKTHGTSMLVWHWILFGYNEHQLPQARAQAEAWGVDHFLIVKSFRDHDPGFETSKSLLDAKREFISG